MFCKSIIGVLLIGVASGLRICDDCTKVDQCKEALNLVVADKSEATRNMLKEAKCGPMKVCCLDFSNNARKAYPDNDQSRFVKSKAIHYVGEIENHPNTYLLPDECGTIEGDRIVGGIRANLNEFPWLALISYMVNEKPEFNCGGTVINERYILTAAHCIKGKTIVGVRVGEYDISSKKDCTGFRAFKMCQSYLQNVAVSKEIVHPGYVPKIVPTTNDIGLLRLMTPLNLTVANAAPICLPVLGSLQDMNLGGQIGIVAGWGKTEDRPLSDVLLKVEVPIYDKEICKTFYGSRGRSQSSEDMFSNAFCAGESQRDSCSGDSGGPLMMEALYKNDNYKIVQFGVVSYGPKLCGSQTPGVYMDVRKYMKWILDTIEP